MVLPVEFLWSSEDLNPGVLSLSPLLYPLYHTGTKGIKYSEVVYQYVLVIVCSMIIQIAECHTGGRVLNPISHICSV